MRSQMKAALFVAALLFSPQTAGAQRQEGGSSGSINVDCEETGSASVTALVPPGSTLTAEWTDLSNIKESSMAPMQFYNGNVMVTGSIRGLDKQEVAFGIKNCPGGGHGTLKVYYDPPAR